MSNGIYFSLIMSFFAQMPSRCHAASFVSELSIDSHSWREPGPSTSLYPNIFEILRFR